MSYFNSYVDSVAVASSDFKRFLAVGLSSLDGQCWAGTISIRVQSIDDMSNSGTFQNIKRPISAGISMLRFFKTSASQSPFLCCACDDGLIKVFSTSSIDSKADISLSTTLHGHDDVVSAINCNSQHIASAGFDGSVKIWDGLSLESSTNIYNPIVSLPGAHSGPVLDISYSHEMSSKILASIGSDKLLRIWDSRLPANHGCVSLLPHDEVLSCVTWHNLDNHSLFTGSDRGQLYQIDLRNLSKPIHSNSPCYPHASRIRRALCISPVPSLVDSNASSVILTCSDDTTIAVHETGNSKNSHGFREINRFFAHSDYVNDLAIDSCSEEKLVILSASTDKSLQRSVHNW